MSSGERPPLLISTSEQREGVGRNKNSWTHFASAIAFSFTLAPHPILPLTPLEVGALLQIYFAGQGEKVFLKWPNDLLNGKGQKWGGILSSSVQENLLVVGVGLNLGELPPSAPSQWGTLWPTRVLKEEEKKSFPFQLAQFITSNRLAKAQVHTCWEQYCWHSNKLVVITDGEEKLKGIFWGIGPSGEAIVEVEGKREVVLNGSLEVVS